MAWVFDAACSFPGENARSWEALGEARPGQSSLSAGKNKKKIKMLIVKIYLGISLELLRAADKKNNFTVISLWDLEYKVGSIRNNNLKLFLKVFGVH